MALGIDLGGITGSLSDLSAGLFGGGTGGSLAGGVSAGLTSTGIGQIPFLKPVQPAKRRRRRATDDPFDFFGTLFTQPQTANLNPIAQLNKSI